MLKIGIILGSVREGRNGEAVANWMYEFAKNKGGAEFELVDLADYDLPLLGPKVKEADQAEAEKNITAWKEKMASLRSEEHTSELQSRGHLVCRLLLEKKKTTTR